MKKLILLYFILLLFFSCTVLKDARVLITNKSDGRDAQNKYYWNVELKNEGEKPAYFVILIISCWKNGSIIEKKNGLMVIYFQIRKLKIKY